MTYAKRPDKITQCYLQLPVNASGIPQRYGNLDYGLRIQLRSNVSKEQIVNTAELPRKEAASFPKVIIDSSVEESAEQFLDDLVTSLGFKVASNMSTDFVLRVTIKDYQLRVRDYNVKQGIYSSSAAMVLSWELLNSDNETVIASTTSTGRSTARSQYAIANPLLEAYVQAFASIDWDRIASALKVAKTAKQEKNAQVNGDGNTALEHTVIRWYILSSPQGADVSWRVVSSTPDVANTNSNFVGTTPYESTESFDIKGLTYNNSGNVQIEISCEKQGYLTQRKRFNLRQAIDQKEISAKFNLVKEDIPE
ncbi:MAG: hypothetical protein K2M97_04300 [Muribaculaceae bacterium]|nr:hypothetical protein [Muribaculaceae bacterium]